MELTFILKISQSICKMSCQCIPVLFSFIILFLPFIFHCCKLPCVYSVYWIYFQRLLVLCWLWSSSDTFSYLFQSLGKVSKCSSFVTEDGGSIDTLHYMLGVGDFKWEHWCPDSNHIFKLDILNPMGSIAATRLEDIESGFICLKHSFNTSFHEGLTVTN